MQESKARRYLESVRHIFDSMFVSRRNMPAREAYQRVWLYTKLFLAIISGQRVIPLEGDENAAGAISPQFVDAMLAEDGHLRCLIKELAQNHAWGGWEIVLASKPPPFTAEAMRCAAIECLMNTKDGSLAELEEMIQSLENLLPTTGTPDTGR